MDSYTSLGRLNICVLPMFAAPVETIPDYRHLAAGWPPRYDDFEGAGTVLEEGTYAADKVGIKSTVNVFSWLFPFFILHPAYKKVCAILMLTIVAKQ